jgi:plasmid maintenance system antidote protein VapI
MTWAFELYKEIGRPAVEVVREMLLENSLTATAQIIGISHNTLKKYVSERSIPFTPRLPPKEFAPRQPRKPDTRSRFIELDGKSMTISQWAKELGVSRCKISKRLDKGMSARQALQPGSDRHKFPANNIRGKACG